MTDIQIESELACDALDGADDVVVVRAAIDVEDLDQRFTGTHAHASGFSRMRQ
jgi:hypothetical protein